MDGADVEAVEHALRVAGHREPRPIVAEIAEKEVNYIRNSSSFEISIRKGFIYFVRRLG